MTLSEQIKRNPYLKISHCTDIADVESGLDFIRELKNQYGESIVLSKLYIKFLDKKIKLQTK